MARRSDRRPDLQEFWDRRYQTFALDESGWLGAGSNANARLYRCKMSAMARAASRIGLDASAPFSVLDIGCGQGFFRDYYAREFPMTRYTGLDISPRLIDHLRACYPDGVFNVGDISTWRPPPHEQFDLVQALEVLHLIDDPDALAGAVHGMAAAVRAGGHVLLTAAMPRHLTRPNAYNTHPSAHTMLSLFEEAGLAVRAIDRIYFWLPDGGPRNRLLLRTLSLGPPDLIYWLDRLALRVGLPESLGGGPDSRMKLITLQKTARRP